MRYLIETERLTLREFTLDDDAFIVELLNSPGWIKFIGDRNIKTEEQAKIYLENGPLKSYLQNGFGLYLVELKEDKTPIGMCGIIKRDHLETQDIGFAFLPSYTGKGYAYEIAKATLKYALEQLKLESLCAITVPYNQSSIKLIEKIGMQFVKAFHLPNDEEELLLYSN